MVSSVRCLLSLILLSGLIFSPIKLSGQRLEEDIRIDLPAGGRIRIENRYGSVSTETWDNSFVSVGATLASGTQGRRSPIVIDNKGQVLSISVFRAPVDPVSVINVSVKVPAS